MRVLIDARRNPGGIQRSLEELVRRFSDPVVEVDLMLYRETREPRAPVRLEPKQRSWLRSQIGGIKRVFEDRVFLPRRVRVARPQVFVSPSGLIPAHLGCRSILQCHDLWLLDRVDTKRTGFLSAYERGALIEALDRADRIVVPSRSVLVELQDRLPRLAEKARHIYHPLPRLQTPRRCASRSLPEPPFLLTVGTLEPRKNLARLIDAQRRSFSRTGVPLLLVGPYGWRQTSLLEAIENTAGVEWLGAVDDGALDELYRNAAAVVQVSLCEGFGYPMVEAMQREAALVLSDLPVHREIAGSCATYCDPRDAASISGAIEGVLDQEPEQRRVRRAAARRGLERLCDDQLVGRWLSLFEELTC